MDVTTLYSIGELSRRTGLSVRTIRFYSDSGVVAPTTRSPAGHRLYDLDALLRLELLRTLRELGMDLATIRRVLDRELSVAEVAAAHADALDVQIRVPQLRRSVLRVVAGRGSNPEETKLMHRLTQLSGEERRRLIDDFMEGTFAAVFARTPDTEFRHWMAQQCKEAHDPQVDRYWRLVWIVNGWQGLPNLIPVFPWLIQALRNDRDA
ncbi:MerR family transcriptional regulator [Streptomyces sp. NPDC059999]|uniref:helix-turn-helix domain-containing protein n=1 Tax=Streptomyces sp. NPDC059999 TaxID=3347030 RepID=UPI0036B22F87